MSAHLIFLLFDKIVPLRGYLLHRKAFSLLLILCGFMFVDLLVQHSFVGILEVVLLHALLFKHLVCHELPLLFILLLCKVPLLFHHLDRHCHLVHVLRVNLTLFIKFSFLSGDVLLLVLVEGVIGQIIHRGS